MSVYRAAMLKAYWPPLALFYGLPCIVFLLSTSPISISHMAGLVAPVGILFIVGYFLAPLMGPKVKNDKSISFIMAYICLAIFALTWLLLFIPLGEITFNNIIFGVILTFFFGSFPAVIGAIFFIGLCEMDSVGS